MFPVQDGWCGPHALGIGHHCFGDFGYVTHLATQSNPYANWRGVPHSYPPLANEMLVPFTLIPPEYSTWAYLVFQAMVLLAPAIHIAYRSRAQLSHRVLVGIFGVALTGPLFMALDRGNNVVLVVPLFYVLYRSYATHRYWICALTIVAMTEVRPQFILVAVVLVAARQWRKLAMTLVISPAMFIASFLIYGSYARLALSDWLHAVQNYQHLSGLPTTYPGNLSAINAISVVGSAINVRADWTTISTPTSLVIIVLSVALALRIQVSRTFPILLLGTLLPLIAVGTTYSYYLVVLLVPLVFSLDSWYAPSSAGALGGNRSLSSLTLNNKNSISMLGWTVISAALVMAVTPLSLPVVDSQLNGTPVATTPNAAYACVLLLVIWVVLILEGLKRTGPVRA